jgi:hypothetical protein
MSDLFKSAAGKLSKADVKSDVDVDDGGGDWQEVKGKRNRTKTRMFGYEDAEDEELHAGLQASANQLERESKREQQRLLDEASAGAHLLEQETKREQQRLLDEASVGAAKRDFDVTSISSFDEEAIEEEEVITEPVVVEAKPNTKNQKGKGKGKEAKATDKYDSNNEEKGPQLGVMGRFKSKAPTLPKSKKHLDNAACTAKMCVYLINIWATWISGDAAGDTGVKDAIAGLLRNSGTEEGHYHLCYYARAFCDTDFKMTCSAEELASFMCSRVDFVTRARNTPAQHRLPYGEGANQPAFPYVNTPLCRISTATLASMTPAQLVQFFDAHYLTAEWIPWDAKLPPRPWDTKTKPDPLAMPRTVVELKKKLKALLDSDPCPTLAIFIKYNFMGPGAGVHVADSSTILNAVTHNAHPLPKEGDDTHTPEHFAIQRLRTVLCFGHMFHAMCMDFLYRYFYNDWIVCILTWIEFAKINVPPTLHWQNFEHQSEEN